MKLEEIIAELEGIEREWNGHALAEKISGNVVKEAHYKGTATGLRIAINVLNNRKEPPNSGCSERGVKGNVYAARLNSGESSTVTEGKSATHHERGC